MERTGTHIGKNRTGVQMSPSDLKEMLQDIADSGSPASGNGDGAGIAAVRTTYIAEAEPVGSMPPPTSVKGAAKTAAKKLIGKAPEVFLDKLGERLAFERSGVRLYEALLTKCQATPEKLPGMSTDQLMHFRDEEAKHFKLVADCIERLGADPTAQTPAADLTGVESMGIMQVLDDPRTTVAQSLHALLIAELADNAGWELLIQLAQELGHDDMAASFEEALEHEGEHLAHVRQWVEQGAKAELR